MIPKENFFFEQVYESYFVFYKFLLGTLEFRPKQSKNVVPLI